MYNHHRSLSKAASAAAPALLAGTAATIGLGVASSEAPQLLGQLPAIVAALVTLLNAIATFLAVLRRDAKRHK